MLNNVGVCQAHAVYGMFKGHAVFGIASLEILAKSMQTIVEDCAAASLVGRATGSW